MEKIENWFYEDLRETTSTNDSVLCFLEKVQSPCLVSAIRQTKGRGRLGRTWEGKEGNLFVSFAYPVQNMVIGHYALLSGLSVLETIKTFNLDAKVQLKWPNDIMVEGKKISGILFEKGPADYWVMGIGINITHTPEVKNPMYPIACLADFNVQTNRTKVLHILVKQFDFLKKQYETYGFDMLKGLWLDNAYNRGKNISVKQNGKEIQGVFNDLDADGSLILETSKGAVKVLVGDIF